MKRLNPGVWAGLVLCAISLVFFFNALKYPYSSEFGPGPGFFPVWLSGILFVLSTVYLFTSFKGQKPEPDPEQAPRSNVTDGSEEKEANKDAWKNIAFILVCMIAFVILLPNLGFTVSAALFLFVLLIRSYKWYVSAATAAGVSVFLFWLFAKVLEINLPVNALGW